MTDRPQTTDRPIISVDFSDGHEVFQTYYHSQFTENQRAAILHICANAGRDPVPPAQAKPILLASEETPQRVQLTGTTSREQAVATGRADLLSKAEAHKKAKLSGFTGDLCTTCGSDRMRRNGSCLLCEGCGSTTGCS